MPQSLADEAASGCAVRRQRFYLAGDGEALFVVLHLPERKQRSSTGVVFCAPFGWDELCAYRSLRVWADTLAAAGYPALRFDFPGTGDSSGSPRDSNRLQAASAAVSAAASELRATAGCDRIVAIGIGFGGIMACSALADGCPIDDLVLWSVPAQGRQLLRALRAFTRIHAADSVRTLAGSQTPPHEASAQEDGDIDAAGFLMSAETVAALESLDLTTVPIAQASRRRVLLLGVDDAEPDRRLREHFERSGASVTIADGEGYATMMVDPQFAQAPEGVFARTIAWLEDRPACSQSGAGRAGGGGDEPAQLSPTSAASLELVGGDIAVRETPFELDYEGQLLSGVLAEPLAAGTEVRLCAVLLNAGGVRRIGHHRMWVDAARRWAARGVPTLRLDVVGVGDSDGDEGLYLELDALQRREFAGQLLAAQDELERRGLPPRFIVGGLCSGAYWGLHAALTDERVCGLLLLNLLAFSWSDELGDARDARHTRALLGRHELREILGAAANNGWRISTITAKLVRGLWPSRRRSESRAQAAADASRALTQLNDRGVQILLALSHGEPLYDELAANYILDRLGEWPNLRLDRVPTEDHIFRSAWAQRHIQEALDDTLDRTLTRESQRREESHAQPAPSS